ncbi:hypothetical protein [Salinibacter sp.]|uniref:hypothetical protein n=1 Tax=Salinibacter sp. TaxID=2065818 RepID=UPI0021E8B054|nr:hypothetical protein [Salinibacter sp.]
MLENVIEWANANSGFVTILVFVATVVLGWLSGIFQALRNRPQFEIEKIEGPNFYSVHHTGRKHNGYSAHRTAIALYLSITNVGSAPSAIKSVSVAFRCDLRPFSWQWFQHTLLWHWLEHPTVALEDFKVEIGEKAKVYPFLLQGTASTLTSSDTYLRVGKSVNGVVYFEHREAWGGFMPIEQNGKTKIKVRVEDAFGGSHSEVLEIPKVELSEARKWSSDFGRTYETLDQEDDAT